MACYSSWVLSYWCTSSVYLLQTLPKISWSISCYISFATQQTKLMPKSHFWQFMPCVLIIFSSPKRNRADLRTDRHLTSGHYNIHVSRYSVCCAPTSETCSDNAHRLLAFIRKNATHIWQYFILKYLFEISFTVSLKYCWHRFNMTPSYPKYLSLDVIFCY